MTTTTTLQLRDIERRRRAKLAAKPEYPVTDLEALLIASDAWARHACGANGFGGAIDDDMSTEDSRLASAA